MSRTAEELYSEAEQRRLEVILAEVELAITLQRLSILEHSVGRADSSNSAHRSAVESLDRARYLLTPPPSDGKEMWQTLERKINELENLLQHHAG